MDQRKPSIFLLSRHSRRRTFRRYAALLSVAAVIACNWPMGAGSATPISSGALKLSAAPSIPPILSERDASFYEAAFYAQKKSDWKEAEANIEQAKDKILLGDALAERYLNRHYNPTPAELSQWLAQYSDHPQAADIYALAVAKTPALKGKTPVIHKQPTLDGYGDDNGLARADDATNRSWRAGLDAWKRGDKKEAAKLFSSLADRKAESSPWLASAAAYWAWRAYDGLGDGAESDRYLRAASEEPRSFYGILACKRLKEKLDLDAAPVQLTQGDLLDLTREPAPRRAIALVQAGQDELADRELRALFPQAAPVEKVRLLELAHTLGLASAQISMAAQIDRAGQGFDYARYPVPNWRPKDGFKIDPSLVFALMRQESGFRASAVSPGGALGLMQLMPQTASLVRREMKNPVGNVREPEFNMALGQNYVRRLLDDDSVNGNLIYLLTAYNAGPGRLQSWKESIGSRDPLLFIESIPFAQTRHYVMQVMTNYWIYSEIAGKPSDSIYALLHGKWPAYDDSALPLASVDAHRHNG